jgi:hypothetical protein
VMVRSLLLKELKSFIRIMFCFVVSIFRFVASHVGNYTVLG